MRHAVIVVLMLFVSVPVFGDQSLKDPAATARFGALRAKKPNDPYAVLFRAQEPLKTVDAALQPVPKSTIVCGMTVIPADPKIDPKMAIAPKQDNVEHKIRAIKPPICNPAK
jgi:hypothetical protein